MFAVSLFGLSAVPIFGSTLSATVHSVETFAIAQSTVSFGNFRATIGSLRCSLCLILSKDAPISANSDRQSFEASSSRFFEALSDFFRSFVSLAIERPESRTTAHTKTRAHGSLKRTRPVSAASLSRHSEQFRRSAHGPHHSEPIGHREATRCLTGADCAEPR